MICADPFCQLPNDGHRHEGLRDLAHQHYAFCESGPCEFDPEYECKPYAERHAAGTDMDGAA